MKYKAIGGTGLLEEMGWVVATRSFVDVAETTTGSAFVSGSLRVTNVTAFEQRRGTNSGDPVPAGEEIDLEDGAVLAVASFVLLNTVVTRCLEDRDTVKTKLKDLVTLTL